MHKIRLILTCLTKLCAGDQSKYLISQLGYDPDLKSLHEVFEEHQGEIYVNGELIRRLSIHYTNARNDFQESVVLTEHFSAQSILDSDGVKRRSIFFRGKLVICSSWLPDSLKEAFKQSGVVAVINANESIQAKSRIDKGLLGKFWCEFYSKLHDTNDVKSSLQFSEDCYPKLRDYFAIF
jgi:hypothetical protein